MKERAESILAFAELSEFAETPVKYFSMGMRRRLAFAIGTDREPEILLNDEIFAGGDMHFIDKARDRIVKLIDKASIFIFASHNLTLMKELTNRTIWLEHGTVKADGNTEEIIPEYRKFMIQQKQAVSSIAPLK